MPVLADVERVAIIGTKAHVGRGPLGQKRLEGIEILGDRPLADQDAHPLLEFLAGFLGAGRFVFGSDAGSDIGVEVHARQKRAMTVDMAALEEFELGHGAGITVDDARVVHEFGKADAGRVAHERGDVGGVERGAGGLHVGRGHAGRELDADIHERRLGGLLEIADAVGADHIGDFVRVADGCGDAARGDAAVELVGRDQGRFDVEVRVDETGNESQAGDVDHLAPVVVSDPGNAVAGDGNVAGQHLAGDQVKDLTPTEDDIGGGVAPRLCNTVFEFGHGMSVAPRGAKVNRRSRSRWCVRGCRRPAVSRNAGGR